MPDVPNPRAQRTGCESRPHACGDDCRQFRLRKGRFVTTLTLIAGAAAVLIAGFVAPPFEPPERPHLATVRLDGTASRDNSGFSISRAGDIDGDGRGDIVIGAYAAAPKGKPFGGETSIVLGRAMADGDPRWGTQPVRLEELPAGTSVRIVGRHAQARSGVSVSDAGDVDGDGKSDILIGTYYASHAGAPRGGKTVLIFGRALANVAARGERLIDLDDLLPSDAVTIMGPDGPERTGWSVSSAGDVDANGLSDIIIGGHAPADAAGFAAVVFAKSLNKAARSSGLIDLADLRPGDGVALTGAQQGDFAGLDVAGAGDVNVDGHADVLVGAFGTTRNGERRAGAAFLISGAALALAARNGEQAMGLAELQNERGVRLVGAASGDNAGHAVSGAGDVDGDGRADILIGAWSSTAGNKRWQGAAYIVFGAALTEGPRFLRSGSLDLAESASANRVIVRGADALDYAGWSVSSAGDVDGDGLDDVMIGAYGVDPAGAAYVLFGEALAALSASGGPAVLDLARLKRSEGVRIDGLIAGSSAGFRVAGMGDLDGDGLSDVLMSAPYADLPDGRSAAGQTFIITGRALRSAAETSGVLLLRQQDPMARDIVPQGAGQTLAVR